MKAQLFVTCLVDALAPRVGRAVVDVLEGEDVEVEFPTDQSCCGQPAFNVGMNAEARTMAGHTLDVLDATDGPIVTPSGSCAEMMVHHYPGLFAGTDREEQAERVSARVREFTQFLVDDLGVSETTGCGDCSVAVHYSCHGLRGLGLDGSTDALVHANDRVELEGDRECCGFGGLFSVEMPAVSAAIMDRKLELIEQSGADTVVSGDLSCLLHIEGGLRRRDSKVVVKHVAEFVAEGLD